MKLNMLLTAGRQIAKLSLSSHFPVRSLGMFAEGAGVYKDERTEARNKVKKLYEEETKLKKELSKASRNFGSDPSAYHHANDRLFKNSYEITKEERALANTYKP
jgi:hypothetical protein